jgi:hypothetical protein
MVTSESATTLPNDFEISLQEIIPAELIEASPLPGCSGSQDNFTLRNQSIGPETDQTGNS